MTSIEEQYKRLSQKCPNFSPCGGCHNRPQTQSSFEACATDPLACMEKQAKGETFRATIDNVKDLETAATVDAQAVRDITQFCNGSVDGAAKKWCDETLKAMATTPEQARAAMVARARDEMTGVQFTALADEKDQA